MTTNLPVLLHFTSSRFTGVKFYRNWTQDPPLGKRLQLTSLRYLLHCSGLERNPQDLWGMTVLLFSLSPTIWKWLFGVLKKLSHFPFISQTAIWLLPPSPVHCSLPCSPAKPYARFCICPWISTATNNADHSLFLVLSLSPWLLLSPYPLAFLMPLRWIVFSRRCSNSSSARLFGVVFPQDCTLCLLSQHTLLRQSHSLAWLPLLSRLLTHQICIAGRALFLSVSLPPSRAPHRWAISTFKSMCPQPNSSSSTPNLFSALPSHVRRHPEILS